MVPFGFFPRPRIRKWCGMELKNAVIALQRNGPVCLRIKSREFLMQGRVGLQEGMGVVYQKRSVAAWFWWPRSLQLEFA